MKLKYVKELHSGDKVHWTDPDNGLCSRQLVIGSIKINGDIVRILDKDGNYLECLAKELD